MKNVSQRLLPTAIHAVHKRHILLRQLLCQKRRLVLQEISRTGHEKCGRIFLCNMLRHIDQLQFFLRTLLRQEIRHQALCQIIRVAFLSNFDPVRSAVQANRCRNVQDRAQTASLRFIMTQITSMIISAVTANLVMTLGWFWLSVIYGIIEMIMCHTGQQRIIRQVVSRIHDSIHEYVRNISVNKTLGLT